MGQAWNVSGREEHEPELPPEPEPIPATQLPVNFQAWHILQALEEEARPPHMRKLSPRDWFTGIVLAIMSIPAYFLARISLSAYSGSWMLVLGALPSLVFLAIMRGRLKSLRDQYRGFAAYQLRESGLLENIMLGLDQLPDIYAAVHFPWQPFLGPRPRTLLGSLKLLARNLDWYLDPVQPYARLSWKVHFAAVVAIPPLLYTIGQMVTQPWGRAVADDPALALLCLFMIPALLFAGLSIILVLVLHDLLRQRVTLEELARLLRQRLTGEGKEPEEPVDPGW